MKRKSTFKILTCVLGAAAGLAVAVNWLGASSRVRAANNFIVASPIDGAPGSLRYYLGQAQDGDTITFDTAVTGPVLLLDHGPLNVSKSVSIQGPGADQLTIQSSSGPLFFTQADTVTGATISGVKLTGATNSSGSGGAIYNISILTVSNCVITGNSVKSGGGGGIENTGGTLTVNGCTISNNSASSGGGIENDNGTIHLNNTTLSANSASGNGGGGIFSFGSSAFAFINNSTISGNSSGAGALGGGITNEQSAFAIAANCTVTGNLCGSGFGGGIENNSKAVALVVNCTINGNTATGGLGGGGLDNLLGSSGTVQLYNNIIAGNSGKADCAGAVSASADSHNLFGTVSGFTPSPTDLVGRDPQLLPLANYGGPTETEALGCNSPAIDGGADNAVGLSPALADDQRGLPRVAGAHIDIGAYELEITIAPSSLPDGTVGATYDQLFTGSGGNGAYKFAITSGSLPPGFALIGNALKGKPTQTGSFAFTVEAIDSQGAVRCAAYTLTIVCGDISITSSPISATVCAGSQATFSASATGSTPTVQWQVSIDSGVTYANVNGATSTTLSFTAQASQNGYLYRAVFTGGCGSVTTQPATIMVTSAPVVVRGPQSRTVCSGRGAAFSAVANGVPSPTIQWQVSTDGGMMFSDFPGATNVILSFTAAAASQNGFEYRAVFTNSCGTAATQAATLTVTSPPVVTSDPQGLTVCAGTNVSFTAAASGATSVQWQVSTNGGSTYTNINGATSTTLSFTAQSSQRGNQYRAVFTVSCATAATQPAVLFVDSAPSIIVNPQSQTACSGQAVLLSAVAGGDPSPSGQWQVSTDGGRTFANMAGAIGTAMNIATDVSINGFQYRVVFTNGCGTATSQPATLTIGSAPVITSNPLSATVCAGSSVTFSASASGSPPPAIQWQSSSDGGATFANIPGATSATLTFIAAVSQNATEYRAAFANGCGVQMSQPAALTVDTPPAVTLNPLGQSASMGGTVTFTARASGSPAPSVQWQVSTDGGVSFSSIPGATAASLTVTASASASGYEYRAIFTNPCGSSATSAAGLIVADKCLRDDTTDRFIQFNSKTGDYLLTVCGKNTFTLAGRGVVSNANGVLTVTDKKTDRNVTIRYLTNQLTGSANIALIESSGVMQTILINQTKTNVVCACSG